MKEFNFTYSERNLGLNSDNQIKYYAGPIKIEISGWDGCIKLSSKKKWKWLLNECLEIAKEAWEVSNDQISFNNDDDTSEEIIIKYNFKNIKLYIEHSIIFM